MAQSCTASIHSSVALEWCCLEFPSVLIISCFVIKGVWFFQRALKSNILLNTNYKVLFDFKTYTQNSVAGKPAMSQGQSMSVLNMDTGSLS